MEPIKDVLIGAGLRGKAYTDFMTDERFAVIAVADPLEARRNYIKETHGIKDDMCFETWQEMLDRPKFADVAIIATSDQGHYEPAIKALEQGYNLLLEKPVCPTASECADIANLAKEKGVKALVCHVLRYTPLFRKIKDMINEDKLGEIISIHHAEGVGHLHQSHSYVRGNWANTKQSSNMLLAKSCHDIDIIQWLIGEKCTRVHSFGSLKHFTKENMPEGAPLRCTDGCPHADTCYYNAIKLYTGSDAWDWFRNACAKKFDPTDEEVMEALRTTDYGKCVYQCDNDVVDHQVVNMEFANGAVASFNMSAFNWKGRYIRIMGTKGEIHADFDEIKYFSYATREEYIIKPTDGSVDETLMGGHGGGDQGIVNVLYDYLANGYDGDLLSEIGISVENHLTVFAAEESRLNGTVVDVREFSKRYLK